MADNVAFLDNVDAMTGVAAALAFGRGGRRSERVIYYRLPQTKPDGTPNPQAGWIIWGDSQPEKQIDEIQLRGWQPLHQYGPIKHEKDEVDQSPWDRILRHPNGPAEFPLSQLLTYQWFDPKRVPVRGVKFPQFSGLKLTVYPCPECSQRQYLDAIHLGRHLRATHDYTTKDILDYGDRIGIDFGRHFAAKGVEELSFPDDEGEEPEPVEVEEPDIELEPVKAAPRGSQEAKERMARVRAARKLAALAAE